MWKKSTVSVKQNDAHKRQLILFVLRHGVSLINRHKAARRVVVVSTYTAVASNQIQTQTSILRNIVSSRWRLQLKIGTHTRLHTRLTALFPGLPGWAGTRKVKPIWILLKQETVSGSGISWDIRKSAPRSRQITTPAPHHSVFYRPDALPVAQQTVSEHWRQLKIGNDQKNVLPHSVTSTRMGKAEITYCQCRRNFHMPRTVSSFASFSSIFRKCGHI